MGISAWTNEAGARALAAAFPEYPVTPVKLPKRNHLKALLSMAGPDVICLSDSPEAQAVKRVLFDIVYSAVTTITTNHFLYCAVPGSKLAQAYAQ